MARVACEDRRRVKIFIVFPRAGHINLFRSLMIDGKATRVTVVRYSYPLVGRIFVEWMLRGVNRVKRPAT